MRRWVCAWLGLIFLVAACGSGTPGAQPAESIPVLSGPPSGWAQVIGLGSTAGPFFTSGNVTLGGRRTAIHASCTGTGTLIVLVTPEPVGNAAQSGASVTFPCGSAGIETSIEITGAPIPDAATVSATVVEGMGTLRHAAFSLSVEQPQP